MKFTQRMFALAGILLTVCGTGCTTVSTPASPRVAEIYMRNVKSDAVINVVAESAQSEGQEIRSRSQEAAVSSKTAEVVQKSGERVIEEERVSYRVEQVGERVHVVAKPYRVYNPGTEWEEVKELTTPGDVGRVQIMLDRLKARITLAKTGHPQAFLPGQTKEKVIEWLLTQVEKSGNRIKSRTLTDAQAGKKIEIVEDQPGDVVEETQVRYRVRTADDGIYVEADVTKFSLESKDKADLNQSEEALKTQMVLDRMETDLAMPKQ